MLYGDTSTSESGTDYLDGGAGNDILIGGNLADVILGDLGDDWIFGGNGAEARMAGRGTTFSMVTCFPVRWETTFWKARVAMTS